VPECENARNRVCHRSTRNRRECHTWERQGGSLQQALHTREDHRPGQIRHFERHPIGRHLQRRVMRLPPLAPFLCLSAGVRAVISYDAPRTLREHIHRAGRTARAGREGRCITFVEKMSGLLRSACTRWPHLHHLTPHPFLSGRVTRDPGSVESAVMRLLMAINACGNPTPLAASESIYSLRGVVSTAERKEGGRGQVKGD